jgi:hypothetical protein
VKKNSRPQKEKAKREADGSIRKRKATYAKARAGDVDALLFLGHKCLGQELGAEDAERLAKDEDLYY